MNFIKAIGSFFFTVYGFVLFLAGMLIVFPFVVIASFFGDIRGGNFIYAICSRWADVMFPLWGIIHKNIFESDYDIDKRYVFVINHISYMDIPVILKTIRRQHFRVLGKYEMSKIPVFGFIYKNAAVMVERDNATKRAESVKELKRFLQQGISIVIFPEGTFNKTGQPLKDFYNGAFRIAIETQTNIKPILFLDTYKRLNYKNFFSLNPGRSRAVFLDEINVEGLTMKDIDLLKEKVYTVMQEKLIGYNATWIKNK